MKRGGMILAALLFVGGILRVGSPSGPFSNSSQQTIAKGTPPPTSGTPLTKVSRSGYPGELERAMRESFGTFATEKEPFDSPLAKHWGVLKSARRRSTNVIAIFPDPVHTQLALFFDRGIESLQIAAQKQGYEFERAILPWDRRQHPESPDLTIRSKTDDARLEREANPGLLIFRESLARRLQRVQDAATSAKSDPRQAEKYESELEAPLFVWVVGETPTSGLRKIQFERARDIIAEIRAPEPGEESLSPSPLLILGPYSSGSLPSLDFELRRSRPDFAFIYSGTITGSFGRNFANDNRVPKQFASFSENDDYLLAQFLEFAYSRGYSPEQIAVLSEDETAYGEINKSLDASKSPDPHCPPASCVDPMDLLAGKNTGCSLRSIDTKLTCDDYKKAFHLHFPREISQFRAAYQRRLAETTQSKVPETYSPGNSTLPLDLGETGSNDDSVAPYASSQSTLSQESVMLGIVTSLRKHEIKFVVLFATDPLDELFLARYLRQSYPQGQIVVATPDLLAAREEDSLLHGLLGINSYPLFPGLNDRLAKTPFESGSVTSHEDRIFNSSLSEGTFNAMVGLLAAAKKAPDDWPKFTDESGRSSPVPDAPYADYGNPALRYSQGSVHSTKPLLWLSMLGRDGFWPVAGIAEEQVSGVDILLPVIHFCPKDGSHSTLKNIEATATEADLETPHTPSAWHIAYFLCILLMVVHAAFSWFGTVLSDSEAMAQFARATLSDETKEKGEEKKEKKEKEKKKGTGIFEGSVILTLGALCLALSFGLIMSTRHPLESWNGGWLWTLFLWSPLALFTTVVTWDLGSWRRAPVAAAVFAGIVVFAVSCELVLIIKPSFFFLYHGVFWSTRVLHLGSGVSPVLPVLLLAAAAYWWFWMSLRGVSLVDLRRPRLPKKEDLPSDYFRMDDDEAENLRRTAYPLSTSRWQAAPLVALGCLVLTLLDYGHPMQTIEGRAFDWGFSISLAVLTVLFLGTLLKLVRTWMQTQQILSALDRRAIREAFSRLKGFSWKPIWNPGGSTLRESYRVLSRAMENLDRLHEAIHPGSDAECKESGNDIHDAIRGVLAQRKKVLDQFDLKKSEQPAAADQKSAEVNPQPETFFGKLRNKLLKLFDLKGHRARHDSINSLMTEVEILQCKIAAAAGILMTEFLANSWARTSAPVASTDPRKEEQKLPLHQILAEEYVALVYVNFLVSALLRMRTLVICGVGMYVLLLCSVNVYPFQPRPALQTLSIVMILVLGGAIGYVYAQMHRDPILSRLTETSAGELGWDFYVKFISAGAIPVFGLLAAQFPSFNSVLFSWLEPAMQALK